MSSNLTETGVTEHQPATRKSLFEHPHRTRLTNLQIYPLDWRGKAAITMQYFKPELGQRHTIMHGNRLPQLPYSSPPKARHKQEDVGARKYPGGIHFNL